MDSSDRTSRERLAGPAVVGAWGPSLPVVPDSTIELVLLRRPAAPSGREVGRGSERESKFTDCLTCTISVKTEINRHK